MFKELRKGLGFIVDYELRDYRQINRDVRVLCVTFGGLDWYEWNEMVCCLLGIIPIYIALCITLCLVTYMYYNKIVSNPK